MLYDEIAYSYTVKCEIALDGENTRSFSVTASKTGRSGADPQR